MNKILNIEQAIKLSKQLRDGGKKVVVVGGCFDIVHAGHVTFLENAKQQADFLFVLLESDETIRDTKGENRPIHIQMDRAKVLAALSIIDYVVILHQLKTNNEYDTLLSKLKPTIIATTKGDPNRTHKERQAKLINAKMIDVMERIENKSTSRLAKLLAGENF